MRKPAIINRMVQQSAQLDRVFAALSHPARRQILATLSERSATVTEIAAPFRTSLNAVSKHLMVLERARLIKREIVGREHRCSLNAEPLKEAVDCLEHYRAFWEGKLSALEQHLRAKRAKRS
jgi:DNA-binding transcriptional ArsR family regulator